MSTLKMRCKIDIRCAKVGTLILLASNQVGFAYQPAEDLPGEISADNALRRGLEQQQTANNSVRRVQEILLIQSSTLHIGAKNCHAVGTFASVVKLIEEAKKRLRRLNQAELDELQVTSQEEDFVSERKLPQFSFGTRLATCKPDPIIIGQLR